MFVFTSLQEGGLVWPRARSLYVDHNRKQDRFVWAWFGPEPEEVWVDPPNFQKFVPIGTKSTAIEVDHNCQASLQYKWFGSEEV